MGIPSYFSHIIKNHSNIICKKNNISIDNLYIDSNSIIYDVIHSLEDNFSFDNIFKNICIKLMFYINSINPSNNIIIAFDGVAPIAKLEQQRTRRNRNIILNNLNEKINIDKKVNFDTTQITPGTEFMNRLNVYIKKYFKSITLNTNLILSLSDSPGEGEHKIFKYIRDNKNNHLKENTVIYGLDADLIMLSLLHSEFCNNIYLYRETPNFIKQINYDLNPNELYILNIKLLGYQIALDLNNFNEISSDEMYILIKDYIFLCFVLGNDFMPHSPCINIRTNGIDILLDIYRSNFSYNNSLIKDNVIIWKNVKKLLSNISNQEKKYLIIEHSKRDKLETRIKNEKNNTSKEDRINNIPLIDRKYEKYINPNIQGWENRYYEILFDNLYEENRIKEICINYIEALEWTFKYYTFDCPDWRWQYKYHYAPLFSDVIKYIPFYDVNLINNMNTKPISAITQLCYVLPKECHYILPNNIVNILNNKLNIDYNNRELIYCYCKYMWECHLKLPNINIIELEKLLN
jgi:5'-3' exonuclease